MNARAASHSHLLRAEVFAPAVARPPRASVGAAARTAVTWLCLVGGFGGSSTGEEVRRAVAVRSSALPPPVASPAAPVFVGPPVKLRVTNTTGRGLELVRMHPDGTLQTRALVPPTSNGLPARIDTFGGQLWLFKSEGRVVQFLAATNHPEQEIRIGPPAVQPLPTEGTATPLRVEDGVIVGEPIPAPAIMPPPPLAIPAELPPELKKAPEHAHEFLRVHNEERARLGVPPLRWSPKLARYADSWAKHLARSGDFEHRARSVARYGENLFRGAASYSPGDAAQLWLEERALYRGSAMTRADLNTFGHYTQMIWRDTTHVGFAVARGPDGLVIVANYSPGGNRSGQIPLEKNR